MYFPTLEDVKRLAAGGGSTLAPIYREVTADLDTPVSAFLKVRRGRYSFLLESVEGGERLSRFSFIGTEPYRIVRTGPAEGLEVDPLTLLEAEFRSLKVAPVGGLPPFHGGAVGYLSYEVARYFERLPVPPDDTLGIPEAILLLCDTLLVFDHLHHRIKVVSHVRLDGDVDAAYRLATFKIEELVERLQAPIRYNAFPTSEGPAGARVESNVERENYLGVVETSKRYVEAGDVIQVVPSQRFSRRTAAPAFEIYRSLRQINPSPYMYYLELGDFEIVGASPEMLTRVEDGLVETHPIAGTRPRGSDADEDARLEQELRHNEKELAEHTMLLDLGRNDVGRVASPGTVRVPQMFEIERYSHVMHLVSHVTGRLRPDRTPYDALRACFPAGTVSGAPKIRAMEIIAELEPVRRGAYAGAVGAFGFDGTLDTCITIRTLVMKDGVAHIQAGGGIVFDSDPAEEHQETVNKSRALLRAIDQAEQALELRPAGSLGY